jgi:hypothetical protein
VRVVERGDDQVLQHADVILRHHFRIDGDLLEMFVAVDDHGDHAAAGGGLDGQLRHLALKTLLHLLRLLHHVLYSHRYLSSSLFDRGFLDREYFEHGLDRGIGHRFRLHVGGRRLRGSRPPWLVGWLASG